jgi:FtsP/CotA-like multicopper oxidase with cupredoxin domain
VQVVGGLAGVWIVEPDTPQIARSDEHVLVMRYAGPTAVDNMFAPDDSALYVAATTHEAALTTGKPVAYNPFDPPAWPLAFPISFAGFSLDPLGCDGVLADGVIDINGYRAPATLNVAGGRTQLLRLVNGTSDSVKMLKLVDSQHHTVPMRVVGLDGIPVGGDTERPLSHYLSTTKLLLSPAGRADVLVTAAPGQTLTLSTTHFCEGSYAFYQMSRDLVRIVGSAQPAGDPGNDVASAPVDSADTPAARLVAYAHDHPSLIRKRAITFTEYIFPPNGKIPLHETYYATDTTNPNFRERPYYPEYAGDSFPSNADIVVKRGTIEEWYLFNTTMESHVFHIHQMAFVEEKGPGGVPATVDITFVPVGKLLTNRQDPQYPLVKPSLTKVLLDFRNVPRGTFVFHCHMLFHEDRGMMGIVRVD